MKPNRYISLWLFVATVLFLTCSDTPRNNPFDPGGEVLIVASKGGADDHPAWYLNISASNEVEFQIATQAYRATWREPEGAERQKLWQLMVDCYPFYADYQASTERVIPLVLMRPIEEIPVFRAEDATGLRQL